MLALVGVAWLAIRSRELPEPQRSEMPLEAVARVGSTFVTAAQLRDGMQRAPASEEGRAAALEEQIRQSLLLAEAERSGFTRQPELEEAWRSLVVRRFREALESKRQSEAVVSDAEVDAYYASHSERFMSPEQRRLALIFIPLPPGAGESRVRALEQECRIIHQRAVAEAGDPGSFATLARQHSGHPASRHAGGEVGWLLSAQARRAWPAAVVEAAFTLGRDGDLTAPIATAEGWYILKRLGFRPEQPLPLHDVRERIRGQLAKARMQDLEDRQFAELRARHGVEVDAGRVAAVEVPAVKPALVRSLAQQPPASPVP